MLESDLIGVLRRRWWVLAVIVVGAVLVSLVATSGDSARARQARRFAATHTIALVPSLNDQRDTRAAILAGSVRLFRSPEPARRTASELGMRGDPEALAARVDVALDKRRGTIAFTATARRGAEAARLADLYAEEAMALQLELDATSYESELEQATGRAGSLNERLNAIAAQSGGDPNANAAAKATRDALVSQLTAVVGRVTELEAQGPPTERFTTVSTAKPRRAAVTDEGFGPPESRQGRLLLTAGLALVLGLAVVTALDRYDMRLRDGPAAEHAFGLPVLAEIPARRTDRAQSPGVVLAMEPLSPVSEAFRRLQSALRLSHPTLVAAARSADGGPPVADTKVVLVTSARRGEGRTTAVANLAAGLAEVGRSVLAVDFDLRRPDLHRLLDVGSGLDLTDLLGSGSHTYGLDDAIRPTSVPGVRLLACGAAPARPAPLLTDARELLARTRGLGADVVLVDSSPALDYNDAAELSPAVDTVLVVARAGQTTAQEAGRLSELLRRQGAPVAGVALMGPVQRNLGWLDRVRRSPTRHRFRAPLAWVQTRITVPHRRSTRRR